MQKAGLNRVIVSASECTEAERGKVQGRTMVSAHGV